MILHYVTQSSHSVVEGAPVVDAEVLSHRDLHGGDVIPVPDGLEQGVREAEEVNVQDWLLA